MTNYQNKIKTLQHRIQTLQNLAEDFSKHAFLLPEVFIKTLQDTYRLDHQGVSHFNSIQIMDYFNIKYSKEEQILLSNIEKSLRKAKDYYQLTNSYSKEILLSLVQKLQTYLSSIENKNN